MKFNTSSGKRCAIAFLVLASGSSVLVAPLASAQEVKADQSLQQVVVYDSRGRKQKASSIPPAAKRDIRSALELFGKDAKPTAGAISDIQMSWLKQRTLDNGAACSFHLTIAHGEQVSTATCCTKQMCCTFTHSSGGPYVGCN